MPPTKSTKKMAELDDLKSSLSGHKGWFTRHIRSAEAKLDLYKSAPTEAREGKLDEAYEEVEEKWGEIIPLYEKLYKVNPAGKAEYTKQQTEMEEKIDDLNLKVNEAKKEAAKASAGGIVQTPVSSNHTRCKPNTALRPEPLQHEETPAKLRVWKKEFECYFKASQMGQADLKNNMATSEHVLMLT